MKKTMLETNYCNVWFKPRGIAGALGEQIGHLHKKYPKGPEVVTKAVLKGDGRIFSHMQGPRRYLARLKDERDP